MVPLQHGFCARPAKLERKLFLLFVPEERPNGRVSSLVWYGRDVYRDSYFPSSLMIFHHWSSSEAREVHGSELFA